MGWNAVTSNDHHLTYDTDTSRIANSICLQGSDSEYHIRKQHQLQWIWNCDNVAWHKCIGLCNTDAVSLDLNQISIMSFEIWVPCYMSIKGSKLILETLASMPVLTKFPSFKFPQPYHFIIFRHHIFNENLTQCHEKITILCTHCFDKPTSFCSKENLEWDRSWKRTY